MIAQDSEIGEAVAVTASVVPAALVVSSTSSIVSVDVAAETRFAIFMVLKIYTTNADTKGIFTNVLLMSKHTIHM